MTAYLLLAGSDSKINMLQLLVTVLLAVTHTGVARWPDVLYISAIKYH